MVTDDRVDTLHTEMIDAQAEFSLGRPDAFQALYSHADDVTIFGAFGGHEQGWAAVGARLAWAASQFESGTWDYTPISATFGADIGCTVWLERGTATIRGTPIIVQELRVTHVYRLEHGSWKIIHRHADPLVHKATP